MWLLPLLGLAVGGAVITNRLRGRRASPPAGAAAVAEQLAAARSDLTAVAHQEAAGELAPDEAERLRAAYEAEIELLEGATHPAHMIVQRVLARRDLAGEAETHQGRHDDANPIQRQSLHDPAIEEAGGRVAVL